MISVFLFIADKRRCSINDARAMSAWEVLHWLAYHSFYDLLEKQD